MSDETPKKKTAAQRKADAEARIAKSRDARDEQRDEQEATDLEAIADLEENGGEALHTMTCSGFAPGVPVRIAFRAPTRSEYKRYSDLTGKAAKNKNDVKGHRDAQEQLARSCWVYPPANPPELREAVLEAFPGAIISMAIEAVKLAELRSEEEGKG